MTNSDKSKPAEQQLGVWAIWAQDYLACGCWIQGNIQAGSQASTWELFRGHL